MSRFDEPRSLWAFLRCDHRWITRGYAVPVIWTDEPDGSRSGVTDSDGAEAIADVGPVCTWCGAHRRQFSDYPRRLAPMVAP